MTMSWIWSASLPDGRRRQGERKSCPTGSGGRPSGRRAPPTSAVAAPARRRHRSVVGRQLFRVEANRMLGVRGGPAAPPRRARHAGQLGAELVDRVIATVKEVVRPCRREDAELQEHSPGFFWTIIPCRLTSWGVSLRKGDSSVDQQHRQVEVDAVLERDRQGIGAVVATQRRSGTPRLSMSWTCFSMGAPMWLDDVVGVGAGEVGQDSTAGTDTGHFLGRGVGLYRCRWRGRLSRPPTAPVGPGIAGMTAAAAAPRRRTTHQQHHHDGPVTRPRASSR